MKCTSSTKSRMDANMQLTINSFRQLFPHKMFFLTFPWLLLKSLTFPWQLSNSMTFPIFQTSGHPVPSFIRIWFNFQKRNNLSKSRQTLPDDDGRQGLIQSTHPSAMLTFGDSRTKNYLWCCTFEWTTVRFHTDALTDFHKQQAACHCYYRQAVEQQEMLWHEQ